jgi:predicted nucleotidyltransferase
MLVENKEITALENAMVQNNFFERFNLSKIGVFGSTARGEKSNDTDILVEDNVDYKILSDLRDELQHIMNKRIDIVMAKYANPIVLHRASKEMVYVTRR